MARIFSGVQPTGGLHLGNWLGALRRFAPLQDEGEALFCVVDLHALTSRPGAAALRAATLETAAALLAAGVSPERAVVFNQSRAPAHAELAWMLSCVARLGRLERMTQFKDKARGERGAESLGLLSYPVLMAADVLAHRADRVPVGEDQLQHLELARSLARDFNLLTRDAGGGDFFPEPRALLGDGGARVMSLSDGRRKMSKSDPGPASRIDLLDSPDEIRRKIRRAKTDSEPLPGPGALEGGAEPPAAAVAARPEAWNLLGLARALEGASWGEVLADHGGRGFAELKGRLAEAAVREVAPAGEEMRRLLAEPEALDRVLAEGAERARAISGPIAREAAERLGLRRGAPGP